MTDSAKTVLEWDYEPKDFFEEGATLEHPDGSIEIDKGSARGVFSPYRYDEGREFCKSVHEFLESVFLTQQIQVQKPFTLGQPTLAREHSNGKRDLTILINSAVMTITGGTVDLVVRDASGAIISDSKADRLAKQAEFRSKTSNVLPDDKLLKRMLLSFRNALEDRDNVLIHLYEVREAFCLEFVDEKEARNSAGISRAEWSKFGRLANDEPLLEGRHRGKHSALRNATPEEVTWALSFGQRLIESYVSARQ